MKKYNLSKIMSNAWKYYKEEWSNEILGESPTFSEALKFSWSEAKREVEMKEQEEFEAKNSEAVKAFNWAQKKLGVEFDMTDVQKMRAVDNADRAAWTSNIWKSAIVAVKLTISNNVFDKVA